MKILKAFIKIIFIALVSLILSLVLFLIIHLLQSKLFVPSNYILWVFKSPYYRVGLIYQYLIMFWLFSIFSKNKRSLTSWLGQFIKNYKIPFILVFTIANIVLIYAILFNVSVISDNKIIDYRFSSPSGNEYSFDDIVGIDTGVYGGRSSNHSKGDFYYIVELKDGIKIDLTEIGGTKNDEDPRFIIEELDIIYVNMGINKKTSMDNFKYTKESLSEIYRDKIKNILLNTNP